MIVKTSLTLIQVVLALSRKPKPQEKEFLLKLVTEQTDEQRKQTFAEIYWGLLNSPEFVLSR